MNQTGDDHMTEQVSGWLEGPDGVEAVNTPKHRSTAHSVDIAFPNGETPTIAIDFTPLRIPRM